MTDSNDNNMTLASDGERLLTTFGGSIADEHLHRYAIAMQHAADKDVLDIASGEGYGSFLLSQSARSVQGVDISATAIRHATQKYTAPNLRFSEGRCTQIPFPDASFDLVVSFETIEHITEQFLFLSEIKRVLKPTGMLIISTPDKKIYSNESAYTNPHHQKELTHAEFTQLTKEHFSHVAAGKQFFNTGTTIIFDKATKPAKHYKGDYNSVYFQPYEKTGTYSLVIASDTSFESNSSIFTANDELLHAHGPEIQTSLDIIDEDGTLLSSEKQFSIPKQLQTLRFTIINQPLDEAAFRLSIKLSNKHAWVSLKQIRIMDESSCIMQWDKELIRLKFEGKEGAIQTHQNSEWILQPGAIILSPEITLKNNRAAQHVELQFEIDTDAWRIRFCQTAFDYQEINHELQNTNHELLGNIEQKSKEISKLSSEAKHTQTILTTLENTNHELQNTNHELLGNIEQKSKEISKLSSEAKHTQTILTTLENTNHELQNTNHELLGNIEQKSKEISKLSSEAKHTQTILTTLENLTNEFWEKDFRSRYLRPLNPLRKLTSRCYPLIERLLPPPKLGIDCITKIKNEPNRITFLKNALDLKLFDSAKYLTEFPKVARKRENPYYHYLSKLWTKDVAPKSSPDIYGYLEACFNPKAQSIQQQPVPATLPREDKPLVSVIVVNFNGFHHLEDLLVSLQKQSYENSEIIVVENASTDGSKTYLAENWTSVKTVALNKNEGFAEGNNIGQEAASGRLVCLLNNDTTVDEQWLEELVEEWRKDNTVGAVCSKVVFWKPYVELKLECLSKDASICVSEASLRSFHPKYAKPIYRNEITRSPADWIICEQNFSTYLPYENADKAELIVRNTSLIAKKIRVSLNDILVLETTLETGEHCLSLEIPQDKLKPEYIINNAGSELIDTKLEAGDRGIYELDHGQYDEACDLTAICGCSVLVDPISIANHALFCKDFFAYYEDTDLSLRIRRNGFKLRYAPKSKVYHKHASSSKEDSAFFRYHVARNKQYLNMLHAKEGIWKPSLESAKRHLTHMNKYYADNESSEAEKAFGTQIPQLIQDLDTFRDKVLSGTTYHRKNYFKKIAIYNSYWNTAGGGEYHALMFAQYFSKHGMVDLISETDFNLEAVTAQFGLEIKNCRKRITPLVNTQTTEEYDIFVNSTFCSSLISNAPKSYYILSFPHRIDPKNSHYKKFLMSYTFLANSTYTKEWTKRYWNKESEVVYPSINIPDILESKKSNYILNVGRFFEDGHNKKQLELAQAFSEMKREGLISSDWKLVLAGKVQQGHEHYALKIKENFGEDGIQIKDNLSHEELGSLYSKAFIYWHATGINEDPNLAPDKFEHFGITTCEALSHACIPVVFKAGGQPEIIKNQVDGYVFSNVNELKTYTADLVKMKEHYPNEILKMQKNAFAKSKDFTRSVFFERLETIYQLKQKPNSTKL